MKKHNEIIAPFGTVEDVQKTMRKPRRNKRDYLSQKDARGIVAAIMRDDHPPHGESRLKGEQTRAVRLCAEATRAVMAYADHYQVSFRRATEALILSLPLIDQTPTTHRKGGRK